MTNQIDPIPGLTRIADLADIYRVSAYRELSKEERAGKGQFFTPSPIARFMAAMFGEMPEGVTLLDAGAGVGMLSAAFVEEACGRSITPKSIEITAYEAEPRLRDYLRAVLSSCQKVSHQHRVELTYEILEEDFILAAAEMLRSDLFQTDARYVNRAILNPPYKKINSKSNHRKMLRQAGIETSNLYTAFLALAISLLETGGELVAITPRSFCNGPYFRPFRELFSRYMIFKQIHVFEKRDKAFSDDDVLQENIIFHAVKGDHPGDVLISKSQGPDDKLPSFRTVSHDQIINPDDPHLFIHIASNELDQNVADRIGHFNFTLSGLDLAVSTGRVVDFRAKKFLRDEPEEQTIPLIFPTHIEKGFVKWPIFDSRKPNAIRNDLKTFPMFLPQGHYVVVKRFSSKDERKRIVAAVYDPATTNTDLIAFENHLNVFHRENHGLPELIAKGLTVYLNSTLIDVYFRQFNGHTQVNANDLRSFVYPPLDVLEEWGSIVGEQFPSQREIDELVELELQRMANIESTDPVVVKRRIREALDILVALGLPREQQNDRSAMTLLALLNLTPEKPWSEASNPLIGIAPIMDFIRIHYGVDYAPNTRETIRHQFMHQFVQAALAVENPDEPDRPTNSPKWCYQVEPKALELIRSTESKKEKTKEGDNKEGSKINMDK